MEKIFSENPNLLFIIIGIIFVWTLPWKAWALWRSARSGQRVWFIVLLLLNTMAILEILYIFVFSRHKEEKDENLAPDIKKQSPNKHNMQKPKMIV